MKRLLLMAALLLPLMAAAQKPKTVEFTPEGLPDELLEYLNKSTSDNDKQKENTKIIKAFRASYGAMDASMQRRVTAVYGYAVKAKLRGNPEITDLTRTLTSYATAPGGAANFDVWLQVLEGMQQRSAKGKAVNEWVYFSSTLLSEHVLYRSQSSTWRFDLKTPVRLAMIDGEVWICVDTPTELTYASAKDMNTLHGTTGRYNYKDNIWEGQGGRLDWVRTGLGAEACYADLSAYRAETKFPKFNADSVQFVNTHYFSAPIAGRVEEVIGSPSEPEKYGYPRFRSYQRDFVISDILPGVDYSGSFMMNGAKFITASSKHPASLIFRRGAEQQMAVSSVKFTITADRLLAENATVAFYMGEDSIFNTGVTVRYSPAERRVNIINDPKRNYYSPFIDTYHELDIYCDVISWKTDGTELEFGNLAGSGTISTVSFESSSYYTYRKYREIQGIDEISPVQRTYDYASGGNNEFSARDFSNYIGLDQGQTLLMIHTLCRHGLVTFNENSGMVTVKSKLVDYMNAFSKNKDFDYDALTLESTTRGTNARMDIGSFNLMIDGVEQFVVSDSQQVVVYPDSARGQRVTVGRNRSIHFDGRIEAGKFVFFVTNCDFNYDNFSFDMPEIRKLYFAVESFTNPDSLHPVMTPLTGLVGRLQVDMDDNHSGLTKNKDYPIFQSLENSFVYYDQKNIRGGQYVRDHFYYTLHPFTINNLVDFETDSLQFNGVLTSAGIFPDITYPLSVQRDYYLGFRTETPGAGYPAYGGKGTYHNTITLDHYGLQGEGELDYLTSHSTSKKYLFLPDSTTATIDTLTVREEGGFPDVKGGRNSMHWLPYRDSMAVASFAKSNPMSMYRGDAEFKGRLNLQPQGATAAGTATVREATLKSPRFALQSREMGAEVTEFTLRSSINNSIAFAAQNVRSHVDYDRHRADLKIMAGPARTELQLPKLEAYADEFSWEMDRKTLDLVNSQRATSEGMDGMDIRQRLGKRSDLPGVRFVSTDAAQHGLTYNALRSTYRYEVGDLSSTGVFLINVADAAIAPNADTVFINKGGKMRVLNKARLVANRDSAWHYIYNADLVVSGADSYTGKGWLDYRNDTEKVQKLYLDSISVVNGTTMACGNISDNTFTISSAFGFAGKVRAEGNRKWLYFDGGVHLLQPCIPADQLGLLAYADYTDPEHVRVIVPEQPVDWKGNRLTASVLMDRNTLRPQASFLTRKHTDDCELLPAHGVLTYLGDRQMYMIGSPEKVADPDGVVSPYLALSTDDCHMEGEGPMSFALRPSQASFYAYGSANINLNNSDDDKLTTVFGFTFPIAKELVTAMADALKDDLRLDQVSGSSSAEMRHALMNVMGNDKGSAAYVNYSANGRLDKIPADMQSTMLFDNLRWQYSSTAGLYYDGKVGLIGMGDRSLGLEINLKAQIYLRGKNPEMVFYVEAAKDHWYFFRYDIKSQELTLYSSSGTWEDMVKAIPLEQRRVESQGLGVFRYFIGNNPSEVSTFLKVFNRTVYPEQ